MRRPAITLAAGIFAFTCNAQNVTNSNYFGFLVAVDSQNVDQDVLFPDGDPASGPVSHDVALSLPEPLGGSHDSSASGSIESTGSNWNGMGSMSVLYPSGLTPGVDVPGNGTGSAVLLAHNIDFTLTEPTTVSVLGFADLTLVDPVNPNRLNGLSMSFFDAITRNTVFRSDLTGFLSSGSQSVNTSFELQPGDYSFSVNATIAVLDTIGGRSVDLDYGYTIDFEPVPSPATMSLLGLAGLAATRRRR